jgi:hypothetical protein
VRRDEATSRGHDGPPPGECLEHVPVGEL